MEIRGLPRRPEGMAPKNSGQRGSFRQAGRAADTNVLYGWQQDTDFRSLDPVFDFSVGGWGYLL